MKTLPIFNQGENPQILKLKSRQLKLVLLFIDLIKNEEIELFARVVEGLLQILLKNIISIQENFI